MNHPSLPPIVGLAGYAGAGKDTAALALVELGYVADSFAKTLKEAALALDPIVDHRAVYGTRLDTDPFDMEEPEILDWEEIRLSEVVEVSGWDKAKKNPEVRRTLQRLGTEVGRNLLGGDLWVDILASRVWHRLGFQIKRTVITDARFPNEASFIQKTHYLGDVAPWKGPHPGDGVLIWIDRIIDGELLGPPNDHASASGCLRDRADVIITNNGTVEDLHRKVREAVRYG